MKKYLWQIIVGVVILALAIPLTLYLTSNRESPSTIPPVDTLPPPSSDDQQGVDTESRLAAAANDLRRQFPDAMIGENGYILVAMTIRDVGTDYTYDLGIVVFNGCSSSIYTSPLYVTIIDDMGSAHQYDSVSYSRWGDNAFTGINLPPLTNNGGKVFTFKISPPAVPKTINYRDGVTPVITMGWVQS